MVEDAAGADHGVGQVDHGEPGRVEGGDGGTGGDGLAGTEAAPGCGGWSTSPPSGWSSASLVGACGEDLRWRDRAGEQVPASPSWGRGLSMVIGHPRCRGR